MNFDENLCIPTPQKTVRLNAKLAVRSETTLVTIGFGLSPQTTNSTEKSSAHNLYFDEKKLFDKAGNNKTFVSQTKG